MPLKKPAKDASTKEKRTAGSSNIRELTKTHPEWSKDRRVAAGLNAAGLSKKKR